MKIYNGKIFIDGKFVDGGIEFAEKIADAGESIKDGDTDAGGNYVIPGLIDIHTHGAMIEDASDGEAGALEKMSLYYAKDGVTSWCPTTMTLKEPVLAKAMALVKDYQRPEKGARVAGINMEGPFLSYAKRGAQAAENLHAPDAAMFHRLNEVSGGNIRLVTIAPEEPGAVGFIKEVSKVCTVSIGHTTADYDTAKAAYDAGACHATHLFNAMPPLGHREPGVIGAASDAAASAEMICDGIHIHPSTIRLSHKVFGKNLILVSDSLRCAGMPDGEYTLGGQPITMKDGKATLKDSDTIAGSSIHLMDALRKAVSFGIPLEAAIYAATAAPAKAIRREDELGQIKKGCFADFVILDNNLNVKAVYIGGKKI